MQLPTLTKKQARIKTPKASWRHLSEVNVSFKSKIVGWAKPVVCVKCLALNKKTERFDAFVRADAAECVPKSYHRKEVKAFAGRCRDLQLGHPNAGIRKLFGERADVLEAALGGDVEKEGSDDSDGSPSRGRLTSVPPSA